MDGHRHLLLNVWRSFVASICVYVYVHVYMYFDFDFDFLNSCFVARIYKIHFSFYCLYKSSSSLNVSFVLFLWHLCIMGMDFVTADINKFNFR